MNFDLPEWITAFHALFAEDEKTAREALCGTSDEDLIILRDTAQALADFTERVRQEQIQDRRESAARMEGRLKRWLPRIERS